MWYRNIGCMFYSLVTKHTCDEQTDRQTERQTDKQTERQTDRIMIPKTALA